jgi:hypothetical protein
MGEDSDLQPGFLCCFGAGLAYWMTVSTWLPTNTSAVRCVPVLLGSTSKLKPSLPLFLRPVIHDAEDVGAQEHELSTEIPAFPPAAGKSTEGIILYLQLALAIVSHAATVVGDTYCESCCLPRKCTVVTIVAMKHKAIKSPYITNFFKVTSLQLNHYWPIFSIFNDITNVIICQ